MFRTNSMDLLPCFQQHPAASLVTSCVTWQQVKVLTIVQNKEHAEQWCSSLKGQSCKQSFLWEHQSHWIGAHPPPESHHVNQSHLLQPDFKTRSLAEVLGLRSSTCEDYGWTQFNHHVIHEDTTIEQKMHLLSQNLYTQEHLCFLPPPFSGRVSTFFQGEFRIILAWQLMLISLTDPVSESWPAGVLPAGTPLCAISSGS